MSAMIEQLVSDLVSHHKQVLWTECLNPPLSSYVEALKFNVIIFGVGNLWKVLGLR
jgi:hypothetical protein